MSMTRERRAELQKYKYDYSDLGLCRSSAIEAMSEALDALDEAEDRLSATIAGQRVIDQRLRDEKDAAEAKLAEAERSGIVCAYCGGGMVDDDDGNIPPANLAEKMAAHIATCEKHPLRAVTIENTKLLQLAGQMETIVAKLPRYLDTGEAFVPGRDEAWAVDLTLTRFVTVRIPYWNGDNWRLVGKGPYSTREAAERAMRGEK